MDAIAAAAGVVFCWYCLCLCLSALLRVTLINSLCCPADFRRLEDTQKHSMQLSMQTGSNGTHNTLLILAAGHYLAYMPFAIQHCQRCKPSCASEACGD